VYREENLNLSTFGCPAIPTISVTIAYFGQKAVIACEQCAVIQAREPEIEGLSASGWNAIDDAESCATCATLKEQEESAALEWARCKDLPDAETGVRIG
jgi:hypothetical protein